MMHIAHDRLQRLVQSIFAAAGCHDAEAARVARSLVDSNLAGHDSHGVIRVASYVDWLRAGKVVANQHVKVVFENDCLAVCDGQFGFGQVIGEEVVRLGVQKAERQGVSAVSLRDCGHLGRIGEWAEQAAAAGMISLLFVNTSGAGILVAPWGGKDRRLSANPIAAGVPLADGPPLIVDISTSSIAEGKIRVALNKGVPAPEGCLIDGRGDPTTDPKVFYGDPGAILPFGGHKGYALGVLAEVLAGSLTGGGCTTPGVTRLSNGLLAIFLNPRSFGAPEYFAKETARFIDFVRGGKRVDESKEILLPGEPEARTRAARQKNGIELDDTTWGQISATCEKVGLANPDAKAFVLR